MADIEKWKKERSLVWLILLYPDNEKHLSALDFIKRNYSEYAYIKHKPESNETKEHYHVVVRFKNYRWNTALAEELEIEINMFEKGRSLDNSLLYLVHFREEDKTKYEVSDVQGPLQRKLERLVSIDGRDSSDIAIEIVAWINTQDQEVAFYDLFRFASQNGYYGELVRAMRLFERVLSEHNSLVKEQTVHYD